MSTPLKFDSLLWCTHAKTAESIEIPFVELAHVIPLEVFIQRNFVTDFFREKLNFIGTNSDIAFMCHPLGDLGVTYTVHLWLVRNRVVDFL